MPEVDLHDEIVRTLSRQLASTKAALDLLASDDTPRLEDLRSAISRFDEIGTCLSQAGDLVDDMANSLVDGYACDCAVDRGIDVEIDSCLAAFGMLVTSDDDDSTSGSGDKRSRGEKGLKIIRAS